MSNAILADYLPRKALAHEINRSIRTLERWEREGTEPVVTKMENTSLYHIRDVRDWLASLRKKQPRRRKGR